MNTVIVSNISYFQELEDFPLPIIVEIFDDIDIEMVQRVQKKIAQAVAVGQAFLPVVINSTGGNAHDAMHIVELLTHCGIPVHTVGMGLVASGAALIFTCGQQRFLSPNSRLMIHDVSADMDGNLTGAAMKIEAQEMEHLRDNMCRVMAQNIGAEPDYFKKLMYAKGGNVDVYLSPQECLEHKLATEIGVPKLQVQVTVNMSLTCDPDKSAVANLKKWSVHRSSRKRARTITTAEEE
jgi:ATP-dependent protease ClpP protease subunit